MIKPYVISFLLTVCLGFNVYADTFNSSSVVASTIDQGRHLNSSSSQTVPEPATVFLLVVGGLLVINRGRLFSTFFNHKH